MFIWCRDIYIVTCTLPSKTKLPNRAWVGVGGNLGEMVSLSCLTYPWGKKFFHMKYIEHPWLSQQTSAFCTVNISLFWAFHRIYREPLAESTFPLVYLKRLPVVKGTTGMLINDVGKQLFYLKYKCVRNNRRLQLNVMSAMNGFVFTKYYKIMVCWKCQLKSCLTYLVSAANVSVSFSFGG